MKILSPNVSHKTDVGGVRLNLQSDDDVRVAFEQITTSVRTAVPSAKIDGVTVQEQIAESAGQELILGAKKDETFGAVLLLGMGGITAELLKDRVLELPPLNERSGPSHAREAALLAVVAGLSRPAGGRYRSASGSVDQVFVSDRRFSQIKEFDINPLLASPHRVVALDARAVRDERYRTQTARPFEHLAIRPYPEGFNRLATLRNGSQVLLRPIRPEDEQLWHALIASCSSETIHARFRYLFKGTTHEMASRFCFIDYDREMAIVAELEEGDGAELIGVCRLVADPGHEMAEYAILIGDEWQGQDLGLRLTEFCLEIAKSWGIKRLVATTERTNFRMIALFRHFGFDLTDDREEQVVCAAKQIDAAEAAT